MTTADKYALQISTRDHGSAVVITLRGSANMVNAETFQTQLHDLASQSDAIVVIDMSELDFLSVNWIHALLVGQADSVEHHSQIRLVHPNAEIKRMLEITRLTEIFPIFDTVAEALNR